MLEIETLFCYALECFQLTQLNAWNMENGIQWPNVHIEQRIGKDNTKGFGFNERHTHNFFGFFLLTF